MARQRATATELAKLLNSAGQPIYVLDDEFSVIFINRACHQWLGGAAEDLLGRRCAYHSAAEVSGPQAVAAGLCPPPAAMAGREVTAAVAVTTRDGRVLRRRARFVPLGPCPEDLMAVVAILDTDELPDDAEPDEPASPSEAGSAELHEQIRRFRRQAAASHRVERFVGRSPAIRLARRQIEVAAESRCGVLVIGPPGSGRDYAAAAIHYGAGCSPAGSLVPLDCSVLGAELIRSTVAALVAGLPPGGQTGGNTLLLGDADELPADVQAELAAVLVGRSLPLRPIATARRPLGELVRRGNYREDLACLLSTITIELPPLCQRREDLPLLAQMFLEEANARGTRQLGGFSPEALDRLDAYGWPGNLDELAQVVYETHGRAEGPEILAADLPKRIHLAAEAAAHPRRTEETIVLDDFLGRVERELIRRALARAKGNKAKAARLLGMTRPRLYRRLMQLGLEKEAE